MTFANWTVVVLVWSKHAYGDVVEKCWLSLLQSVSNVGVGFIFCMYTGRLKDRKNIGTIFLGKTHGDRQGPGRT